MATSSRDERAEVPQQLPNVLPPALASQSAKRVEPPREKTLGEAVEALQVQVRRKTREFYNRPIPEGTKTAMDRLMGEKPD